MLLKNHERMIGGVRNFKVAMEARNSEEESEEQLSFPSYEESPQAGKDVSKTHKTKKTTTIQLSVCSYLVS